MKKTHIVMLVLIVAAITVLISYTGNLTTYETIASAKEKQGKFVNLIAKIDKTQPVEYDAIKNQNYLVFSALDTLCISVKVIYHNTKPTDMEKSERIVLKGKMNGNEFECKDILYNSHMMVQRITGGRFSQMEYLYSRPLKKPCL